MNFIVRTPPVLHGYTHHIYQYMNRSVLGLVSGLIVSRTKGHGKVRHLATNDPECGYGNVSQNALC